MGQESSAHSQNSSSQGSLFGKLWQVIQLQMSNVDVVLLDTSLR